MGEEEHADRGVIELAAIVALNCLNGTVKLRVHKREKLDKMPNVWDLRRKGNV
jgi:hypothetical protein